MFEDITNALKGGPQSPADKETELRRRIGKSEEYQKSLRVLLHYFSIKDPKTTPPNEYSNWVKYTRLDHGVAMKLIMAANDEALWNKVPDADLSKKYPDQYKFAVAALKHSYQKAEASEKARST